MYLRQVKVNKLLHNITYIYRYYIAVNVWLNVSTIQYAYLRYSMFTSNAVCLPQIQYGYLKYSMFTLG